MKVVIATHNKIKIHAITEAFSLFGLSPEFICVAVPSGINKQPEEAETFTGARNRAARARERFKDADWTISIESGLFKRDGQYDDKAVICLINAAGVEYEFCSAPVRLPTDMVEKARQRGFKTTTVGDVMAEVGRASDSADPHLALTGVSRGAFLRQSVSDLLVAVGIADGPTSLFGSSRPKDPVFPVPRQG